MNIFSHLSDDQMALVLCVGALVICGLMMSLSHYIGSNSRKDADVSLPVSKSKDSEQSQRKAA
jgi:hypothetical protein